MNAARPHEGRLAVATATTGTVLIAVAAFWLSFTALTDLAHRSGIDAGQAWAWPLIVDGLIVVATVAVVALDRHRTAWYPWLLLISGTLVSVTANALHATVAADADVPALLASCVAAVPPLLLLASTHLTVVLARSRPVPEADLPPPANESEIKPAPPARNVKLQESTTAPVPGLAVPGRRAVAVRLRDERHLSNKAIARELGVAPSTVGRWFAKERAAAGAPDGHTSPKEQPA